MTTYIAVYGSLRRGMQAEHLMNKPGLSHVGQDTINATLYDLGWYPGIVLGGQSRVVVDVHEVDLDSNALHRLHQYEGYIPHNWENSLFVLKRAFLNSNGKEVMCYEYNRNVDGRPIVDHGDWVQYVQERAARPPARV